MVVALVFLLLGLVSMAAADYTDKLDEIKFSPATSRPWNNWDIASVTAFVLFASFSAVAFMLAAKDD